MSKEERFTQLIQENEGMIFKVTSIYSDNEQDQKDLYQEIVYQLWKSFESFENRSKMSTWLYRVALNTAITEVRNLRKHSNRLPEEHEISLYSPPEEDPFYERITTIYNRIKLLNKMDRAIILLFLEGIKGEEIAEITGLSYTNVNTKLSRIKQKLRSQIAEQV